MQIFPERFFHEFHLLNSIKFQNFFENKINAVALMALSFLVVFCISQFYKIRRAQNLKPHQHATNHPLQSHLEEASQKNQSSTNIQNQPLDTNPKQELNQNNIKKKSLSEAILELEKLPKVFSFSNLDKPVAFNSDYFFYTHTDNKNLIIKLNNLNNKDIINITVKDIPFWNDLCAILFFDNQNICIDLKKGKYSNYYTATFTSSNNIQLNFTDFKKSNVANNNVHRIPNYNDRELVKYFANHFVFTKWDDDNFIFTFYLVDKSGKLKQEIQITDFKNIEKVQRFVKVQLTNININKNGFILTSHDPHGLLRSFEIENVQPTQKQLSLKDFQETIHMELLGTSGNYINPRVFSFCYHGTMFFLPLPKGFNPQLSRENPIHIFVPKKGVGTISKKISNGDYQLKYFQLKIDPCTTNLTDFRQIDSDEIWQEKWSVDLPNSANSLITYAYYSLKAIFINIDDQERGFDLDMGKETQQ